MLSPTVRDSIMYGSLFAPLVGVVWMARGRHLKASAISTYGISIALIAAGCIACWWARSHSIEVFLVTDAGIERRLAKKIEAPVAPAAKGELSNTFFDGVWVVNGSKRKVHVETITYGGMGINNDEPIEIGPGTSGIFYHIDYLGPTDHPPESIVTGSFIGESRYWLTW